VELSDYLAAAKRRWWILVLVPVAAAACVVALQVVKPASYQATATVAAPALVGGASSNQYTGSAGPKTFVANFQAVLTSPVILDRVSHDVNVPKSRISAGLSSSEVGLSSVMLVTYTGTKKSVVGPVANDAARQTLLYLFQTQVNVAHQPLVAAQQQLANVNTQLANFAKASGTPVPDRDYQVLATEISQLEQTQAQATATNNTIEASRLQPEITAKQQQLSQLAGVLSTYLNLKDQQSQAQTSVNAANATYQQAAAQYAAANPNTVITLGGTSKVGLISATAPGAAVAFGSGLALAIGIVFLLEAMRRRRIVVDEAPAVATAVAQPSVIPASPTRAAAAEHGFEMPTPPAPPAPREPVTVPAAAEEAAPSTSGVHFGSLSDAESDAAAPTETATPVEVPAGAIADGDAHEAANGNGRATLPAGTVAANGNGNGSAQHAETVAANGNGNGAVNGHANGNGVAHEAETTPTLPS
jgi:capsular polysaccharide biosynthesis protein